MENNCFQLSELKKKFRIKYAKLRKELPIKKNIKLSKKIVNNCLDFLKKLSYSTSNNYTIFSYMSRIGEVDILKLNNIILLEYKEIYLPYMSGENILYYKQNTLDNLIKNKYGILEPAVLTAPADIDVISKKKKIIVICPGLSFDIACNRLGAGKGYYDRFFAEYSPETFIKIGLTFDYTIENLLPINKFDAPMDYVITEKNIYCNAVLKS